MGDMGDIGQAMRQVRKERHADWKQKNMAIIRSAILEFRAVNNGECLTFRLKDYPIADFYPSTGRWRSEGKTYGGHAEKFLVWLRKNRRQ
jgi:hypothetical protein